MPHPPQSRSDTRRAEAADTQPLAALTPGRMAETADTQPIAPPGLGLDADSLNADIHRHLSYTLGRDQHSVSNRYRYIATVMAIRDRLMERWKATHAAYYETDCKRGYYLSMEFLMGRALGNAVLNLGVDGALGEALRAMGLRMEDIADEEADAGLGNGGLGRLAPASSTRAPRCSCRCSVTAFATTTACSVSASSAAPSSRNPTTGSPAACRGNSSVPNTPSE